MARILALAAVLLIGVATTCEAGLKLKVTDGVTVKQIHVNDGIAEINDAVGAWTFTVNVGLSSPVLGPPLPHIHLHSAEVSGGAGAEKLTIELWDTAEGPLVGPGYPYNGPWNYDIGGVTAGTVESWVFADGAPFGEFAMTDPLGSLGPFGSLASNSSTAFSGSKVVGPSSESAPLAHTLRVVVDHTDLAAGSVTSFDASFQAVPEPSAFLYGGLVAAIVGLGYRGRQWLGSQVEEA